MDQFEHEGQTIVMARPWPGTVGEARRVTHVFPEPDQYPWRVVAFCGAVFWSGDLEWLDRTAGTPCTACLDVVPTPSGLP